MPAIDATEARRVMPGASLPGQVDPRLQQLIEPAAVCRAISETVARTQGESASLVLLLRPGTLPITSSGKLQRSATRAAWRDGTLEIVASHSQEPAAPKGVPREPGPTAG